MGHDPFSPISSAQVNVLCVPAGRITVHKFEEYLRALRAFCVVSSKGNKGTSTFSKYKDGYVLLNLSTNLHHGDSSQVNQIVTNARPQVVLGLIDGETLALQDGEEAEGWFASTATSFRQSVATINDTALSCLIVFGGAQPSPAKYSYFVDLEGDGPSLPDVVQTLVTEFQLQLEDVERPLQSSLSSANFGESDARSLSGASERNVENALNHERNEIVAQNAVLIGQLNLQAGQWPDALRYFSEAAVAARNSAIDLWHAKALEGLLVCMMLSAWAHLDFNIPQVCYPTNDKKEMIANSSPSMAAIYAANRSATELILAKKPMPIMQALTSMMPTLLSTIISLYERTASIFQDITTLAFLCQSRIRWGNLFLILKQHHGAISDAVLQHLVEGADSQAVMQPKDPFSTGLVLQPKILTRLFTETALEAQSKLPVRQAAQIQVAIASSLSLLGVERKQAFHVRDFLQKLAPILVDARRVGAAEAGLHPSAGLPPLDSFRGLSNGTAQSGIQALLDSICQSYGLPKLHSKNTESQTSVQDRMRESLYLWSAAHQTGDIMMKIEILNLCVEVSDAIPDLQCSLNLAARLLLISLGSPTLSSVISPPSPLLSSTDQSRLFENIQRTATAAAKFGISNARARYWDKCMVRAIDLSEKTGSNILIPRNASDLSLTSFVKNAARKDPFIFNPFAKATGQAGNSVIVVGDQAWFNVVLQNPLQIDVEIEDITLLTEGCNFVPDHHSIVLGPLCSQAFTLSGKAQESGDLLVKGCRATIRGCHEEDFVIVHGGWKPFRATKTMTVSTTSEPMHEIRLPEIVQLSLTATAPLPKLSIVSTSLLQQSIMLLEGEKTIFTLTLRNDSDLDADFLLITFEDSVTRRLEEALGNKDLLPADLYEIQNQIATRPVIRLAGTENRTEITRVARRKSASFSLELFGRPGLTDVTIAFDYACLGKPREEVQGSFYTRQIRHTITTTINGSIDIPRCSVLPIENDLLPTLSVRPEDSAGDKNSLDLSNQRSDGSQCLLLLDVRNIWPQPLEVKFQACDVSIEAEDELTRWATASTVSDVLQPGQMTRLLLVAPRILMTDPYTPIPSLDTKRQFVVSASKMTIEAEAASRESFWYRERLLSCLRANWKEQHGTRQGLIDMRKGIRLSSRMIDALRIDLVEISFSLKASKAADHTNDGGSSPIKLVGESHYSLARNSFVNLVARVHNRSAEILRLLLRLQPSLRNQPHNIALDLSKRFAWTGVLQRALHPPLEPGEIREVELGIVLLAEGEYEVNGTAEEIKSRLPKAEHTPPLEIGNGSDRRIWHARTACSIDAWDDVGNDDDDKLQRSSSSSS